MGAVTALLAANEDPSIAGVVLDSPFASLKDLMVELVERWTEGSYVGVPRAATRLAVGWIRASIKSRANFDTDDLEVECAAETSFCPALFAHGRDDDFIDKRHSERLCAKYAGDHKPLLVFNGDHNSPRPSEFFDDVELFFQQTMWETVEESSSRRREREVSGSASASGGEGRVRDSVGREVRDEPGGAGTFLSRKNFGARDVGDERDDDDDDENGSVVRVRGVLGSPRGSCDASVTETTLLLNSMGFDETKAAKASRQTRGDLERALGFLLDDETRTAEEARGGRTNEFSSGNIDSHHTTRSPVSLTAAAIARDVDGFSDADLARALQLSLESADKQAEAS